jgi:hypothetical protein
LAYHIRAPCSCDHCCFPGTPIDSSIASSDRLAGRISTGELDTPVRVKSQSGFEELTRSLADVSAAKDGND